MPLQNKDAKQKTKKKASYGWISECPNMTKQNSVIRMSFKRDYQSIISAVIRAGQYV